MGYGFVEIGLLRFGTNEVPSHVNSLTVWIAVDTVVGDATRTGGNRDCIVAIVSAPAAPVPAESLTSSLMLRSIDGSVAGNVPARTCKATRCRMNVIPIGDAMLGTAVFTKA